MECDYGHRHRGQCGGHAHSSTLPQTVVEGCNHRTRYQYARHGRVGELPADIEEQHRTAGEGDYGSHSQQVESRSAPPCNVGRNEEAEH